MPLLRAILAWTPSEMTRVRAASRAGALVVAALAFMLAAQRIPSGYGDVSGVEAGVVEAFFELQTQSEDAPVREQSSTSTIAVAAPRAEVEEGGGETGVWLWRTDARGRFVFNNRAQYERCLAARATHRNEADCPSPSERAEIVLDARPRTYADASLDTLDIRGR